MTLNKTEKKSLKWGSRLLVNRLAEPTIRHIYKIKSKLKIWYINN